MTRPDDQLGDQTLPPEAARELYGLVGSLCDGVIADSEFHRLNQILDHNCLARRLYLRYIAVHSALVTTAGSCFRSGHARRARVAPITYLDDFRADPPLIRGDTAEAPPWRALRRKAARRMVGAAAAILCVAGLLWLSRGRIRDDAAPSAPIARRNQVRMATEDMLRAVAEITYVAPRTLWEDPNDSYTLAAQVRSGQRLALVQGVIELTYASGTTLLLTGPAEFLVNATGGTLGRGEVTARVTEQGHGFTIVTPHGKIIDLGTEFGVVVDDFGVSEVRVFEGKVEALPTFYAGMQTDKIELTTGRALQWNANSILRVNAGGRRYGPPDFDVFEAAAADSAIVVDDDFRSESLNEVSWQTLGGVRASVTGLQLCPEPGAAKRPYIITRHEFDPSAGPITVSCEVQFSNLQMVSHPSFSILTRSADTRSAPGTPWEDLLARCVRCSLKADPETGDGMLESGTKYEGNRELSNISWRGFARPHEKTSYRLEMRDDGLNVTFTVSLAAKPSVRKTVTCRSLFRGNRNFIALEGCRDGTATVKNVRIVQERLRSPINGWLARGASGAQPTAPAQSTATDEVMAELAPRHAELILTDSFDDEKLNKRLWTTLGDVRVENAQLRLGAPNDEEHIDTWMRRPHLFTSKQFSPASAPLTIIGRATFAPNYLHGYGGSFAVITRADREYGNGFGWEQSILRRGVRSNFWPAALGQNQSLQIFERTDAESPSVLVAEGFQIDPQARSYIFRVIDDGRSAFLTFIDAANPDIRKTISHVTASESSAPGHIAFESCWGSPVMLDDIRIYETRNGSPPGPFR